MFKITTRTVENSTSCISPLNYRDSKQATNTQYFNPLHHGGLATIPLMGNLKKTDIFISESCDTGVAVDLTQNHVTTF